MPTLTVNGVTYETEIHPMTKFGSFDDLDGVEAVYMFARVKTDAQTRKGKFQAVYVGETGDVNDRLRETHHQIACIRRKKATHIFIYRDEDDALLKEDDGRRSIEDDWIQRYRPECQRKKWA